MKDRLNLAWSLAFAALGAGLGLVYFVWVYGPTHGHPTWWGHPTDAVMLTQAGSQLLHGRLSSVYSSDPGLYSLPLSFPLAGIPALLVGWLRLDHSVHQESILVVVPFFCATSVPVLYQARRLAWDLGLREHLRAVQFVTGLLVIPALVEWGHPEDVLALAFVLSALRWLVHADPVRACFHLSVAVSFKQWAVVLLPLALLAAPRGQRGRAVAASCALPVVLASVFLAVDFHHALRAFTEPTTQVWGFPGHPSVLGEWLGPRSSQIARLAVPLIAAGVAYRRRFHLVDPVEVVGTAALILLVRPLLETINYSYYWPPALILLVIVTAARRREFTARDWLWSVLVLAWALPHSNDLTALDWWAGEGLLLAVTAYRFFQAGRHASRTDGALFEGLVARPQPAEVAG